MKVDTILVFDFGGQHCHLIARRVRENHVYSEIVPYDTTTEEIVRLKEKFNIKGIILSGGPLEVYVESSPKLDKKILDLGIPILGMCYGNKLNFGFPYQIFNLRTFKQVNAFNQFSNNGFENFFTLFSGGCC